MLRQLKRSLGIWATSLAAAMNLDHCIRDFPGFLNEQRFSYNKKDAGEVVYIQKENGEESIKSFGACVWRWCHFGQCRIPIFMRLQYNYDIHFVRA